AAPSHGSFAKQRAHAFARSLKARRRTENRNARLFPERSNAPRTSAPPNRRNAPAARRLRRKSFLARAAGVSAPPKERKPLPRWTLALARQSHDVSRTSK